MESALYFYYYTESAIKIAQTGQTRWRAHIFSRLPEGLDRERNNYKS